MIRDLLLACMIAALGLWVLHATERSAADSKRIEALESQLARVPHFTITVYRYNPMPFFTEPSQPRYVDGRSM